MDPDESSELEPEVGMVNPVGDLVRAELGASFLDFVRRLMLQVQSQSPIWKNHPGGCHQQCHWVQQSLAC